MKKFIQEIFDCIWSVIDDTLKREKDGQRRFSKTALTMLTAWVAVLYVFIDDYIRNGFRWESFIAMLSVATGVKVADAIAKNLNKNNNKQ